jgi:hypothetical protein
VQRVIPGLAVAGRCRLRISCGGMSRIPLSLGVPPGSDAGSARARGRRPQQCSLAPGWSVVPGPQWGVRAARVPAGFWQWQTGGRLTLDRQEGRGGRFSWPAVLTVPCPGDWAVGGSVQR